MALQLAHNRARPLLLASLATIAGLMFWWLQGWNGLLPIVAALTAILLFSQTTETEVDLRDCEQRYRELFDQTPQPLWVYDAETLQLVAVNSTAVHQYGFTRDEFLKMRIGEIGPAGEGAGMHQDGCKATEGGSSRYESRHRRKNGLVFPVEIICRKVHFEGRPAVLALCTDISERKRAERRARAFSNLGRRLSAVRTPQEAAEILMDTADELFGWDACTFDLCSEDPAQINTVLYVDTVDGQRMDVSAHCRGTTPSLYTQQALRIGAQLILRPQPVTWPAGTRPFGDKARPSASLMYAPVRNNSKIIGVLSIQSYTPNAYTEEDLRTLQALADHCSGALERIRAELEIERLNAELEKRVRDRTAQLEAINKELETFSYSVSHDLRAPLRSIRGFSEVLLERHAPQLDASGREFLRRACESSQQMDLLIEDLLKFSRIGRSELVRQPVDLSALAESISAELRKADPERAAEFVIAPGMHAEADGRLLRVALDNLLRNAWKFSGKVAEARIEFGFCREPEPAFFVRDNGTGFDMQYAGKLFGVFQRLHSASEFPGTGVGLATVQRIINRHGGRIWAHSAPNQGASFYFTLPGNENPLS